jgi:photosystem II stability/assembly factor-like uncharacterized protein
MTATSHGRLAALWACVALTACGGGGGAAPTPPSPPPVAPTPVPASVTISGAARIEAGATEKFTTDVKDPTGLSFAWDFGDGTTSTDAAPTHAYTTAGNYRVALKVSNTADKSVGAGFDLQAAYYSNVAGLECSAANSGGWCWQNTHLTGHALTQAQFYPNASWGWVIGDEGTVARTVDSGDTWSLHTLNAIDDLLALNFDSSLDGLVLSRSGTLSHSDDGGKNWTPLTPPGSSRKNPSIPAYAASGAAPRIIVTDDNGTQASFDHGVTWSATNLRHAFTVGADCYSFIGTVKKSAGCNSTPAAVAVGAPLGTVFFAGSTAGTVTPRIVFLGEPTPGAFAMSFVSQDGGANWLPPNAMPFLAGGTMRLVDVKHAWYVDADKAAWISGDGGVSFVQARVPAGAPVSRIAGLAETGGTLYYAWTGKLALTTDFGATEPKQLTSPEPGTDPASGVDLRVHVWDGAAHAVVSYDGRYYVTHDAGAHWTQVLGPDALGQWMLQDPQHAPSIAFADGKHGTLALSSGLVQSTTDGGLTWNRNVIALTQPTRLPVSVAYASPTAAWMTLDGLLWASSNGGSTWAQAAGAAAITGVTLTAWPDATHGWLGKPAGLYASTDSGATWKSVALGSAYHAGDLVNSIAFENTQVGLVGLTRGTSTVVLRTTDGGTTWTQATSQAGALNVTHTGGKSFWLNGSTPLQSADEGVTWKTATPPAGSTSLHVFGGLGTALYAFDNAGLMFGSNDTGATWTNLTLAPDTLIGAGFALDSLTVWTVTQNGNVLATATAAK